jgi:2-iminobutanoate/2-iminopropanoate deaminase
MKPIHTPHAPAPAGHYSQAMIHGNTVYVSGLLPIDPASGERILGSPGEQTDRVLTNLKAVLEAAGSGLEQVVKATVYIADIAMWGEVNATYARFFGDHKPARAIVPTRALHHGFLVEVEAVAAVETRP